MSDLGGGEESGRVDARRWRTALSAGYLLLAGVLRWVNSRVTDPSVVFDENGYLGNARRFAGSTNWQMPRAPAYAIGYPVVISPIMRVFHTAGSQWHAVLTVNALLLALVFPLLAVILNGIMGTSRSVALAAAAAGAFAPTVMASGVSGIAENLALPTILASVIACWAMVTPGPVRHRIWFGPAIVVLYSAHARFTPALVIGAAVIAWATWRALIDRGVAAVNLGFLLVGTAAVHLVTKAMIHSRWPSVEHLEGGPSDWFDIVTSGSGLNEFAKEAIGQAWYLAIGSAGIAIVGALVVGARLRAGRRAGASAPTPEERARRAAGVYLAALAGSVFLISTLFFTQNQFRTDHFVYGRHNDSFTPLFVAVGLAALVEARTARTAVRLLGTAAAVVATLGVALIVLRDPHTFDGTFSPFAAPAIARFVGHRPYRTFWLGTVGALAALVVVAGVTAIRIGVQPSMPAARRRVRRLTFALLTACTLAWGATGGLSAVHGTERYQDLVYRDWNTPQDLRRLGVDRLQIESRAAGGFANLAYAWHLPDVPVTTYDAGSGQQPTGTYVVARVDTPSLVASGHRILLLDEGFRSFLENEPDGLAVWVRPGPEQDRLQAAGRLLPAGFPGILPVTARSADLRLRRGAGTTIRVVAGGSVTLPVAGRSTGTGSPWPDAGSFNRPDRVRVSAHITGITAGLPDGARSGGELPRWILPGDRFQGTVQVFALTGMLRPLPPGRYRVQLGIAQDDRGWFTSGGPDATFTLLVSRR